jgi:hypothetical protein
MNENTAFLAKIPAMADFVANKVGQAIISSASMMNRYGGNLNQNAPQHLSQFLQQRAWAPVIANIDAIGWRSVMAQCLALPVFTWNSAANPIRMQIYDKFNATLPWQASSNGYVVMPALSYALFGDCTASAYRDAFGATHQVYQAYAPLDWSAQGGFVNYDPVVGITFTQATIDYLQAGLTALSRSLEEGNPMTGRAEYDFCQQAYYAQQDALVRNNAARG